MNITDSLNQNTTLKDALDKASVRENMNQQTVFPDRTQVELNKIITAQAKCIRQLREALEWYADPMNFARIKTNGNYTYSESDADNGLKAYQTLAATDPEKVTL